MRTTVIPAQITTVEDKIAGNLNMMQIFILMIPIFFATLVFAFVPPIMHVALYKLPPVLLVVLICLILSLRVKEKVVAEWLKILLSYNFRPRFYVFNKNDSYLRDLSTIEKKNLKEIVTSKKEIKVLAKKFGLKELKQLESFIKNPNYSFSLKPGKKGGLYVAVSEIK